MGRRKRTSKSRFSDRHLATWDVHHPEACPACGSQLSITLGGERAELEVCGRTYSADLLANCCPDCNYVYFDEEWYDRYRRGVAFLNLLAGKRSKDTVAYVLHAFRVSADDLADYLQMEQALVVELVKDSTGLSRHHLRKLCGFAASRLREKPINIQSSALSAENFVVVRGEEPVRSHQYPAPTSWPEIDLEESQRTDLGWRLLGCLSDDAPLGLVADCFWFSAQHLEAKQHHRSDDGTWDVSPICHGDDAGFLTLACEDAGVVASSFEDLVSDLEAADWLGSAQAEDPKDQQVSLSREDLGQIVANAALVGYHAALLSVRTAEPYGRFGEKQSRSGKKGGPAAARKVRERGDKALDRYLEEEAKLTEPVDNRQKKRLRDRVVRETGVPDYTIRRRLQKYRGHL